MAQKPENKFISQVHKHIRDAPNGELIHSDKTNNPYVSAMPDVYYDSPGTDLWVEYKWFTRIPPEVNLTAGKDPILTQLQARWINRAFDNGRDVWVVIGFRLPQERQAKAVVLDGHHLHWDIPLERSVFLEHAVPQAAYAQHLMQFLLEGGGYGSQPD